MHIYTGSRHLFNYDSTVLPIYYTNYFLTMSNILCTSSKCTRPVGFCYAGGSCVVCNGAEHRGYIYRLSRYRLQPFPLDATVLLGNVSYYNNNDVVTFSCPRHTAFAKDDVLMLLADSWGEFFARGIFISTKVAMRPSS